MSKPRIFSFYGVTTGGSSIMRLFPRWAEYLGLEDVRIEGTDLPIHADAEISGNLGIAFPLRCCQEQVCSFRQLLRGTVSPDKLLKVFSFFPA